MFKPIKQWFDSRKAMVLVAEKRVGEPLERAKKMFGDKLVAWDNEQERLVNEENARREAEERERTTLAQKQSAAAIVVAAMSGDANAVAAAEEAHSRVAEQIAPAVAMTKETPKVAGFKTAKRLKIYVDDPKAAILAIAAREMLAQLVHGELGDNFTREQQASIEAFLTAFYPAGGDYYPAVEFKESWLKAEAQQRGPAFKLAGVRAEREKGAA